MPCLSQVQFTSPVSEVLPMPCSSQVLLCNSGVSELLPPIPCLSQVQFQCPVCLRSSVPHVCLRYSQCPFCPIQVLLHNSRVSELLPMPCSSQVQSQCPVCHKSSVPHMCLRYSQCPVCPRSCCITPMCQSYYQHPVHPRSSPNAMFVPGPVYLTCVQGTPNALFIPGPVL
jgi:hypothetical protein